MAKSQALQTNLDVDYVIVYRFAKTGEWGRRCTRYEEELLTTHRKVEGNRPIREACRSSLFRGVADRGPQRRLAFCPALCESCIGRTPIW